ncbi:tetratricopeptide repeat protein [Puniceicoccaceae bacterium K14]|nr:tetratricopeptide repeat protein [Puniceicoccaceae bacterium K14]
MTNPINSVLKHALTLAFCLLAGCSSEKKVEKFTAQADDYFDQFKYSEAEITYLNVLKIDEDNANAQEKFAHIYFNRGQYLQAEQFIKEHLDDSPKSEDLSIKYAYCLFALNKWQEAYSQAIQNFEQFPNNPETAIFLADTSRSPEQISDSKTKIQNTIDKQGESASLRISLGYLELKSENIEAAEKEYTKAEALDRNSPSILSSLGTYYWFKKEFEKAEQSFFKASSNAPLYSPRKMLLAQFELRSGKTEEAISTAKGIESQMPDFIPVLHFLAEAHASQNDLKSAFSYTEKTLKLSPYKIETLILKGRIQQQQEKLDKAIETFSKLTEYYPAFPEGYNLLAQALLASGREQDVIKTLDTAEDNNALTNYGLKILAETYAKREQHIEAEDTLLKLVELEPQSPQVWFALAKVQLEIGEPDKAMETYKKISEIFPNNPQSEYLIGRIRLEQRNIDAAEESFNEALKRDPDFPPAIEELAKIDFANKRFPQALERVETSISEAPESAPLHYLKGMIHTNLNSDEDARKSFERAIELEPKNAKAHLAIAQSYSKTGNLDQAIEAYLTTLKIAPDLIIAKFQLANHYEFRKEYEAAQEQYLEILEDTPNSPVVYNNLAYLLSEYLNQKEKAFEYAKQARELAPEDPMIADTLGWIAYQRKEYKWSYDLISEAHKQLPNAGEITYHLGMAAFRLGYQEEAQEKLTVARTANESEAINSEIDKALSILTMDENDVTPENIAALEDALKANAEDSVLLYKLAKLYLATNKLEESASLVEKIIELDSSHADASFLLVDIYQKSSQSERALEVAKSNYNKYPDNFRASFQLGKLVLKMRDFDWSYTLLSRAYQAEPSLEDLAYNFSIAAFAIGDLENASEAASQAISTSSEKIESKAIQLEKSLAYFLNENTEFEETEASILDTEDGIENAPSKLAHAWALEVVGQNEEALSLYENLLSLFPNHTPALSRILRIKARTNVFSETQLAIANKIRQDNPDRYDFIVALACYSYIGEEYERTLQYFEGSRNFISVDAEALFFWGMAYQKSELTEDAIETLSRAIDEGLKEPFLTEAKSIVSQDS